MPRVLIADKMDAVCADGLKARGIEVDYRPGLSPDDLNGLIAGYDGVAVRSTTKINAATIAAAKGLKVIGRAGIGVDTIDVAAASAAGIVVMNTPFGNAITTAEHTIAMMMALARQIPQANASTHAGKWEKSRFMGMELAGKTLGLVGCGNIGAIVAERALGLKMKVLACDPFLTPERARALGVEMTTLEALYPRADIVTVHTPLTDKTRGLIDKKAIAAMKKGVRILNIARGGLVVEADLKEALDSGHVAGAALDVYETEPAIESVFFGMPNVICTPHLGASTLEAQEKVAEQIGAQIADFLLGGTVANAVNMPALSADEMPMLAPYMRLCAQLGALAGQLADDAAATIEIAYKGHAAALNTRPLTAALLAAFLGATLEGVNMVSAPAVARARGIALSESRGESAGDFNTLVALRIAGASTTLEVSGTVFAGTHARLVSIDSVPLEAALEGPMLLVRNIDRPGLIGGLGTVLAQAKVNIADFRLGRTAPGGHAVSLVALDSPIDDTTFAALAALPQVERIARLRF